jgi:hypothetical protein
MAANVTVTWAQAKKSVVEQDRAAERKRVQAERDRLTSVKAADQRRKELERAEAAKVERERDMRDTVRPVAVFEFDGRRALVKLTDPEAARRQMAVLACGVISAKIANLAQARITSYRQTGHEPASVDWTGLLANGELRHAVAHGVVVMEDV